MKPRSAFAGILTLLATLFTITSPVFAQSINDTLAKKKQETSIPFDFESVAKRLSSLSEPSIDVPEQDSLSKRLRTKIKKDILGTHGRLDLRL